MTLKPNRTDRWLRLRHQIPLKTALLDELNIKHIPEVDLPGEQAVPEQFHVVDTRDGCRLLERD